MEEMQQTYLELWKELDSLVQKGRITEFEKTAVKATAMVDKAGSTQHADDRNFCNRTILKALA